MAFDRPLARVCIRVFEEDYEKVKRVAEAQGVPVNVIIRECLRTFVRHLTDVERRTIDGGANVLDVNEKQIEG